MPATATRVAPVLAVQQVSKSFGRTAVLRDVDLEVAAGEAVAVVGENGAGKSTLLRICAGLDRPTSGEVRISGRVGYCPQTAGLYELLTAEEHLVLFGRAAGLDRGAAVEQGRSLLGDLGMGVLRRQVRQLSGGGRQKLNLALALLGHRTLLLLDEPYQGFDHGSYVNFWEHVGRWRDDGLAVVVVTHLLPDAHVVDRVVELPTLQR